jgi:hypothetical protein
MYLQSRLNYIIWRNILNHYFQISDSPSTFSLNLRPYSVLLILLFVLLRKWSRFADISGEVRMGEVQVNQTTAFLVRIGSIGITEELFFMSFYASVGNLNLPINKKFFIQKLILIFVPLQKIRPRKSSEKLNIKTIFNQP